MAILAVLSRISQLYDSRKRKFVRERDGEAFPCAARRVRPAEKSRSAVFVVNDLA
jgi:hypothetical protein